MRMVALVAGQGEPRRESVQVVCKKTRGSAEVHCGVCGQGFVVFWERQTARERIAARPQIQEALRRQHRGAAGREPHPHGSFFIPDRSSATALVAPGSAPAWGL